MQTLQELRRMLPLTWKMTCLALALTVVPSTAALRAQSNQTVDVPQIDLAVTFTAEHSLKAATNQSFWMYGGSFQFGVPVKYGFGVAADFTGTETNSIGSTGVPLVLESFSVGPRYRWHPYSKVSLYGQALFGEATGSRSIFPSTSGSQPSASSFAQQYGGGVDYRVGPHISLRAVEAAYVHTALPNGGNNQQNLLKLGAGIVFRFNP